MTDIPQIFIVSLDEWDRAEGKHKHKVLGVAAHLEVAQQLMMEKTRFILKHNGQLRGESLSSGSRHRLNRDVKHVLVYGHSNDHEASELEVLNPNILDTLHDTLIKAQLASAVNVSIPNGQKGFCINIAYVDLYTDENVEEAPKLWKEMMSERVADKKRWVLSTWKLH